MRQIKKAVSSQLPLAIEPRMTCIFALHIIHSKMGTMHVVDKTGNFFLDVFTWKQCHLQKMLVYLSIHTFAKLVITGNVIRE